MQFGSKLGEFGSDGQGSVIRPAAHLDPAADVVPVTPTVDAPVREEEPKPFVVGNRYGQFEARVIPLKQFGRK